MLKQLKEFTTRFQQYRQRDKIHSELDILLGAAQDCSSLEDKLHWLIKLLQWIRYEGGLIEAPEDLASGRQPIVRIRFLFLVLERNPQWKAAVAKILRAVIREVSGLELYTETGLPRELGMWSEMWDRLLMKVLPTPPLDHELGYFFWALFPDKEDSEWVATIDQVTFDGLVELIYFDIAPDEMGWNHLRVDLEDALMYLVIQVRAIGLSPAVRHRLNQPSFRDSAFFKMVKAMEDFFQAYHGSTKQDVQDRASHFRSVIWECRKELREVHHHLDEYGVSVNLVFQMTRLRVYLSRIENLLEMIINETAECAKVTTFMSNLIAENQELRSISSLLSQNVSLLARKVVERAAETGEHYITRSKEQYREMFQAAAGGGIVTAATVYFKVMILALGASPFMEGLFASFNYSISFLAIHFLGFTLGTKQPAMTAPALAEKMTAVETEQGMTDLVTEITHLIRSQVAAVFGNVLLVVPCVILIDSIIYIIFGGHVISEAKALKAFNDVDILGPAVLYGAFTGILLWMSSLFAGWSDNWFALHSLKKTLSSSPSLKAIFGKSAARLIATFAEKNMSGIAANVSLGVFLGMTPEILKFIGLPLDIRHVTLSSGNLASAIPVMGVEILQSGMFWRAIMGIFFIGVFNVGVSFSLAMMVAIKGRNIKAPQRKAIKSAVWKRFRQHPLSFFLPVGPNISPNTGKHGSHS